MKVERVRAETVRPLRRAVLRPEQPPENVVFPGDSVPGAFHAAISEGGAIVAVATIAPDPHPREPRAGDWRVRGMASAPAARGRGAGSALLRACLDHALDEGGARVWCNAREGARRFYERHGFAVEGERFEIEGIGAHYLMSRPL